MRICLVSQEYPPETGGGGIGTQTWLKARGLARRGHEVRVVSMTYQSTQSTAADDGVLVHRIPHPGSSSNLSETSVHWLAWSWAAALVVGHLVHDGHIDLVEFPEYGAEGFIHQTETAHRRSVPVVVMLHGSLAMFSGISGWPNRDSSLHRVGTWLEDSTVQEADLLLAASQNIAGFWTRRMRIPQERIHVLGTAVDNELFVPQTRGGDRPTVLFVGRISRDKGVTTLARAVRVLAHRHEGLLLRIAGEGAEDVVQEVIAHAGEGRVEILGRVPHRELVGVYAGTDVFAAPSPGEHGIASVYLEAMASGRPVVACDCGGPPEVVVDGVTGLLVRPDDVGSLVEALDKLLASAPLRQSLGVQGRRVIEAKFSVDSYAARAEQEYEALLECWPGSGE